VLLVDDLVGVAKLHSLSTIAPIRCTLASQHGSMPELDVVALPHHIHALQVPPYRLTRSKAAVSGCCKFA
jgi:hypothetical protein